MALDIYFSAPDRSHYRLDHKCIGDSLIVSAVKPMAFMAAAHYPAGVDPPTQS